MRINKDVITLQFRLKDGLLIEVPLFVKIGDARMKKDKLLVTLSIDCNRAKSMLANTDKIESLEDVY